jgi:flagellar hook assembly protein FlgD
MTDKTRLSFTLGERGRVQLKLFDLRGRLVVSLLDETMEPGRNHAEWDGRNTAGSRVGAGIYWAQLQAGGEMFVKRVVVLR